MRAVDAVFVGSIGPSYPCPCLGCWVELPKVVEEVIIPFRIEGTTAEEPEVTIAVDPTDGAIPCARNICSGGSALHAVNAVLVGSICTIHPSPCFSGWVKLPEVI